MIRPASHSITIIRRSTFRFAVQVFVEEGGDLLDLSEVTVLAQLWNRARDELYTSLTIDTNLAATGVITLSLTSDQTIPLPRLGVYDIKLVYPNGDEFFILVGSFTVQDGYTDD